MCSVCAHTFDFASKHTATVEAARLETHRNKNKTKNNEKLFDSGRVHTLVGWPVTYFFFVI